MFNFIFLRVLVPFSQHHLLKSLSFLHCTVLPTLLYVNWPYVCELFLAFYPVPVIYISVLVTVTLQYSLKSGSRDSSNFVFFLKIALAIQGLLCLHIHLKFFSNSVKNAIGNLIGISLSL